MLEILNKGKNLEQIIHVHSVFVYKIYSNLIDKKILGEEEFHKKNKLVKTIFTNDLFKERGRTEIVKEKKIRTESGIHRNKVLEKISKLNTSKHSPSLFRFIPNPNSFFITEANKYFLPFVAGPSGHTGSLLLGAKLYGDFNKELLQDYTLACFSYLACGGNHSFHEVMIVAKNIGIDFDPESYTVSFSKAFLSSDLYKTLREEYRDLLPEIPKENSENKSFISHKNIF